MANGKCQPFTIRTHAHTHTHITFQENKRRDTVKEILRSGKMRKRRRKGNKRQKDREIERTTQPNEFKRERMGKKEARNIFKEGKIET